MASIKVDQNVNAHKQRKARKFKTEYQENFRKFQFTTDLSSNQQFVERKGGKDTTQTNNGPEECMNAYFLLINLADMADSRFESFFANSLLLKQLQFASFRYERKS